MVDPSKDMAGGHLPESSLSFSQYQLQMQADTRAYRFVIFLISILLIGLFYLFFAIAASGSLTNTNPHTLILIGFIGAIPTLLLIGLTRHTFGEEKEKPTNSVSISQELLKEITRSVSDWLKRH